MKKEYIEKRKKFTTNTYMKEAIDYDIVLIKEKDFFITIKKYKEVSSPFVLTNEMGNQVTYIDNGYYVLELTPLHENYNIRYYYDQYKKFIDYYIDITYENGVQYMIPYYVDLYLDILHYPIMNHTSFFDEDELKDAFKKSIINQDDFDMAYRVGNQLLKEIDEHSNPYLNIDVFPYLEQFF